jgi:hypothetical protein
MFFLITVTCSDFHFKIKIKNRKKTIKFYNKKMFLNFLKT